MRVFTDICFPGRTSNVHLLGSTCLQGGAVHIVDDGEGSVAAFKNCSFISNKAKVSPEEHGDNSENPGAASVSFCSVN